MNKFHWLSILVITLFIGACTVNNQLASKSNVQQPSNSIFHEGKFYNNDPMEPNTLSKLGNIIIRYFTDKSADATPKQTIPVEQITTKNLDALSDDQLHVVKLGHSSILLKVYGEYWLLDPVFSKRASPFSFMGPKRFHQAPISINELPAIDKVLISHNHYDHLDKASVKTLAAKTKAFLVPLGVGEDLKSWGIKSEQIKEFDWWQEEEINQGFVAFTPTQHFSGRSLTDGNKTLWGSWVIKSHGDSVYFSGDSGYFPGFKDIGKKYGPFDLTMIETGAYDKDWSDIHMTPEQSVQAHIDVKGKVMMPIHNGTFDLAFHAWYEPLERVNNAAIDHNVTLFTPIVGKVHQIDGDMSSTLWWRELLKLNESTLAYALNNLK